ncbi:ADP-ribosylation factor-like protein 13A isoform X2 [Amia ocellicauda]|uniref:ADP-ribosylation factor-like protein 13A isoform X2 n=1 Tax=Amia ocellicauda TaxID=2972642 RepID=UPI003463B479
MKQRAPCRLSRHKLKGRWWPLCYPQPNMFNLVSNCCSWIQKLQQPVRKATVLMVGLDKSGKTSTIRGIVKAPPGEVSPTVGCVRTELRVDSFQVTLLDVGGGADVRGAWRDHYGAAHGIIFVVDSSDTQRIRESRDLLMDLLKHSKVAGKPLLVLANKQDKMNALLGSDLIEALSLEKLVNKSRSLCHIEPCSALLDVRRWSERKTLRGLRWLLRAVFLDYSELCARVARDNAQLPSQEEKERRGKAERGRSKPQEDRLPTSRTALPKDDSAQAKEKKPLPNGKLEPIRNILKTESDLKRRAKKKKHVKIKDAVKGNVQSHGEKPEQDPESNGQKEGKAGSATITLLTSNRVGLNRSVRFTKESLELPDSPENERSKLKKGKAEKKKKKMTVKKKNRINSEERPTAHPQPVDLSATFDLYRKAILALKARQEQTR